MYKERLKELQDKAKELGIDLSYSPEIAVPDIEAITNEEWLETRKKGIGGSDVGAILGVNKYSSAVEIAETKLSIKPSKPRDPKSQYTLDFGHAMEAPVLALYSALTGNKVWTDRAQYRHPLYPFMLGDCDGYAETPEGEKIGLEVKTYNYEMKSLWKSGVYGVDGKIKNPEYAYQVAHYMAVLNLTRFDLLAMCGNNADDLVVVTFYRDLNTEQNLYKAEARFWADVERGIIPEATRLSDTSFDRVIEIIRPEDVEETSINLSSDLKDTFEQLDVLKEKKKEINDSLKALEEHENILKLAIVERLGDSTKGELITETDAYSVSFKSNKKESINSDKLRLNFPEIYELCKETKETKPIFRMTRKAVKK